MTIRGIIKYPPWTSTQLVGDEHASHRPLQVHHQWEQLSTKEGQQP